MIPYFMTQKPESKSNLFDNPNRPVNTLKHPRFVEVIKSAVEVKYLGAIPGMKFVMDECCHLTWEEDPRIINAQTLYQKYTIWKDQGVSDDNLLKMATEYGYTIVTRDRGFILNAYNKKIPIIYRLADFRLFLVENKENKN